jgi:Flp pilus assembly pilin Flp
MLTQENPNSTPVADLPFGSWLSNSMLADNRAISATEYVIILTLVALAIIAGATLLGQAINNQYVKASGKINNLP